MLLLGLPRNVLLVTLLAASALLWAAAGPGGSEVPFKETRIYFEYNDSANDLGVHVRLDAEDWTKLRIYDPDDELLFAVRGTGGYSELGLTELFFEGAEPSLLDVPLDELLDLFPQGEYEFEGKTVDGQNLDGEGVLSHAIPDGPNVSASIGPNNSLVISWSQVVAPPPGFPNLPIQIDGYQVIVSSFQVTLPATTFSVTVPPEFVASLEPGEHDYEVLAIEKNGNQSITEGTFTK